MEAIVQIPMFGWLVCARPIRLTSSSAATASSAAASSNNDKDCIFVLTQKGDYAILSSGQERVTTAAMMDIDDSEHSSNSSIITLLTGSLMDRAGRPSEMGPLVAIDPFGRCIVVLSTQGFLNVIPINARILSGTASKSSAFVTRLEDLHVIDVRF